MIAADALLNAANARNINAVRDFKKPDSSYKREYNKFKNHITLLRQSGELDEGDKFLTRLCYLLLKSILTLPKFKS